MTEAAARQRVLFRCDASEAIGGGHVMRCLTLADALAEAGAEVTFVAASMPGPLEERITRSGHRYVQIAASPELDRAPGHWEEPPLSAEAQLADAQATGVAAGSADWAVVDHYLLDAHWHSAARDFASRLLVIDDLANRPYDCDVLLDQTFGRSRADYRDLVPDKANILTGSAYAMLRPEFARERPAALKRRREAGPVRRILVSMGTVDPAGITARVVEQLVEAMPECAIDVVLGPQAQSLDQVRRLQERHPQVSVHVDARNMAELMRDADVAVGAAGMTSWERCCLGLPSIVLVLAENQSLIAQRLAETSAHVVVPAQDLGALVEGLCRLSESQTLRVVMAERAAEVCDGSGVEKVRALMAHKHEAVSLD